MFKTITVLIPAYNEEEVIYQLYSRLTKVIDSISGYNFELLFVNDGSKDNTVEILKNLGKKDRRISLVDLSRNFGKEVAMIAGLDFSVGDAVVIIDADLQDPPELIVEMIKYWEQGYDDVYAKRATRAGKPGLKNGQHPAFINCFKE